MSALLEIEGLSRRFGGLLAVDGLSFLVAAGEIVGLLGPNGAGKSTVLDLLSGRLRPDGGRIVFRGQEIGGKPQHRIVQMGIARTFQTVRPLWSLNCRENVLAGLAFGRGRSVGSAARVEADELLERVGLAGRQAARPGDLAPADQKRLELARALALRPELLLLDEWLAGLKPADIGNAVQLIRSLGEQGMAIVMVEHVMDAIRPLCHRCLVMNAGRLISAGLPAEVLAEPEVVRAYLGDEGFEGFEGLAGLERPADAS